MRCPSCGGEDLRAQPGDTCAACGTRLEARGPAEPTGLRGEDTRGLPPPAEEVSPAAKQAAEVPAEKGPTRLLPEGRAVAGSATRRIAWPGVVGGLLVIGASLLPWVSMTVGPPTAFGLPLAFLVDLDASGGEPVLGWVLVGLGAVALGVSPWRWSRWVRPVLGALGLLLAGAFVVQFVRDVDQLRSARFVIDHLGAGVYVTLIGSGLLFGERR